ncbi:helix-turn-helix domain-containing protein [Actinomadura sp. NEAU-AAG7]|uniref:winged helix-turn-helix domain-containing protein n=1 Tax=Actinomadura sp. NEAU-AAG7 TaxID=2839640 RepID=UPI001BE3EF7D|nr:helix-turn-helix domain-containing protein [Actinomadura sp. NEAU-AAG7]MBT2212001.1 winged helix-turn-helix domain-containing protein [Actinomadura sp. NEAU-AAG7]
MSDEPGNDRRKLTDPQELRVLAHPTRLRILQALYELGSATATEMAEHVDESPANCSWHLRQLGKHGFAEETGEGQGRQRPWRPSGRSLEWGGSDEPAPVAAASDALSAVFMEQEFDLIRAWQAWRRTDPAVWQDAAGFSESTVWVTATELAEINAALTEIRLRHRERRDDPSRRPPGSRRVSVFTSAVPTDPAR